MADLRTDPDFEVTLRRFGERQLSGSDLEQIRTALLGMSQEEVGRLWGVSRNEIGRIEKADRPDMKTCDAYRGLMLLYFVNRGGLHA